MDPVDSFNRTRARLTSIVVASGLMMEFIDSTALSTALPTMARDFHIPPENLKLALTTYVLALAMFIPASGWMADRYGARRVYICAIGVFLAGSLACAGSPTMGWLVASRFLQGLGGAMMLPVARTIIVKATPREELVSAMAWFTMPGLMGPLIGPVMSGFILKFTTWHWIFLINLPISLVAMVAIRLLVPQRPGDQPDRPFDWAGFALLSGSVTLLVGAIEFSGLTLPMATVWGSVAGALALAGLYVRHALRTARPVLDLRLFRYASLRTSMVAGSCVRLGFGAFPLILPLYFQLGLGWSPLVSGTITVGTGLGILLAKPFAPPVIRRLGFRGTLICANLLASLLAAMPVLFTAHSSIVTLYAVLVTSGLARSLQFTANNTLAYSETETREIGDTATLAAVTQQLGLAFGVSFGGLLVHVSRSFSPDGQLHASSFHLPLLVTAATMASASLIYMRLPANAGAHMRK